MPAESTAFTNAFAAFTFPTQTDVLSLVAEAVAMAMGLDARVAFAGLGQSKELGALGRMELVVLSEVPASRIDLEAVQERLKAHPLASGTLQVRVRKQTIETHLCGHTVRISFAQTPEPALPAPVQDAARALQVWGAAAEWRPACANCATLLEPKTRKKCEKCEVVHYCSKDCQAAHWRVHKADCLAPSAAGSTSATDAAANLERALLTLAQRCWEQRRASSSQASGMQVFVAALQQLADAASGAQRDALLESLKLDMVTFAALRRRARATLHIFVVSRALLPRGGGFRWQPEVSAWATGYGGSSNCETPAGWVPAWLLKSPAQQRADDHFFADYGLPTAARSDENASSPGDARTSDSVRLLMGSPLAEYTAAGGASSMPATAGSSNVLSQLQNLTRLAERGSEVAERMLVARSLWFEGENAMDLGDHARAVQMYVASLRAAVRDGDPFSGYVTLRPGDGSGAAGQAAALSRFMACADSVLARCRDDRDARLIRAWALMRMSRWSDADALLTALVNEAASAATETEAYGALHMRFTLRANQRRWRECLPDVERCIQLAPEEPMFHYWLATMRKNLFTSSAHTAETAAAFRRFLVRASPHGRKFHIALYELALLDLTGDAGIAAMGGNEVLTAQKKAELLARVKEGVRKAQTAESQMLQGVFEPSECDAKRVLLSLLQVMENAVEGLPPGAPRGGPEELRKRGNEAFAKRQFDVADECYSAALSQDPGNAELLANRAAARVNQRWFTAAAADAAAAAAARPGWAKAHFRAAQAHLGRKVGAAAAAAARAAAQLQPGDDAIARVLAEATRMEEEQRSRKPAPDPRSEPELWTRVLFPDNVHVVSADGSAAYTAVADALRELRRETGDGEGGLTLVLLPGVYEEGAIMLTPGEPVQLLGWNDPTTGKGAASELRLVAPAASGPGDVHLVTAVGAGGGAVVLERLRLVQPRGAPHTNGSSCGSCAHGARMEVRRCLAYTPDSPCFAVYGVGSSLTLKHVKMTRVSAGVVVDENGYLEAEGCNFGACVMMAVEVRGGGSAVLRGCSWDKCASQAAVLYNGGSKMELHDCTFRSCGSPRKAVVMAETGTMLLRACTICECPSADGVILQGNSPPGALTEPVVLMDGCTVEGAAHGVVVFYGSAALTGCTITKCVGMGVGVHGVPPRKLVMVRGCKLLDNGPRAQRLDVFVKSRTLFELNVRLDSSNTLSAPPMVPSDAQAAKMNDAIDAEMARMGLESRSEDYGLRAPPMGERTARAGWMMPPAQAVAAHMETLRALRGMTELLQFTDNADASGRKPVQTGARPALESLRPLSIAQLQPGSTHRGFVLRGRLLVPPLPQAGALSLLEDATGAVVKLSVYNVLTAGAQSIAQRERAAARVLPKSARVAIIEPFFKLMRDGSYGVRVDDPREVIIESS